MKTYLAALVTAATFVATPAFAQFGSPVKTDKQCNTWSNGKYTQQPSTTRNTDGTRRR
jgi:hypothetical protein